MRKVLGIVCSLLAIVSLFTSTNLPVFAATNLNNFSIHDYQIDYYLSRDGEGRSTLKTVESIQALFPATNQNHGLERAIPNSYDGHSTSLSIESVTDKNGTKHNYTTNSSNGNTVLRIGDADSYVHGLQTYKITYIQRDVTKYYADTNRDEFYWDTNGTQWAVPVTSLTARLHLPNDLRTSLTDNERCYQGQAGSTTTCTITTTADVLTASAESLKPRENITIAVGFQPKTFTPYKLSTTELLLKTWAVSLVVTFLIASALTIWYLVRYHRRSNRLSELKTIVPEYLPPKDASVSTAGSIINKSNRAFSAQLIDFAVRHYIKIYQTREKSLFKTANYELEIIKDISNLKDEEQEIFRDLFDDPRVGARLDMETLKHNTKFGTLLRDNKKKLDTSIKGQYGLRKRDDQQSAWFKHAAIITLLLAIITLSPWLLIAAIIGFVCAATLRPLSDKGLELSRYLKGLELYIKTAETERLRMVQSPDGAAKLDKPIDINDERQLIKLYERVLPYAILFGQEKEWNNRLGQYYQSVNESPDWYHGNNTAFNAAIFSTAISNFSSAASYSDPSNSSSGGSGGGGSSGGGGGGGGGGGW